MLLQDLGLAKPAEELQNYFKTRYFSTACDYVPGQYANVAYIITTFAIVETTKREDKARKDVGLHSTRMEIADISGMELNFDDEALSTKPQQDLKDLKYEETNIGSCL